MESMLKFHDELDNTEKFLNFQKDCLTAAKQKLREQEELHNQKTKEQVQSAENIKQEHTLLFHDMLSKKKKEENDYRDESQKLPFFDRTSLKICTKPSKGLSENVEPIVPNVHSLKPFPDSKCQAANAEKYPKEFLQYLSDLSAEFTEEDVKTACCLATEDLSRQANDPQYKIDIECIRAKQFFVSLEFQLIELAKQKSIERWNKQVGKTSSLPAPVLPMPEDNTSIPLMVVAPKKLTGGGGEPIRDEFGNMRVRRGMNPIVFPDSLPLMDDIQQKQEEHLKNMKYQEELKKQIEVKQLEKKKRKELEDLTDQLYDLQMRQDRRKLCVEYQKELVNRKQKIEELQKRAEMREKSYEALAKNVQGDPLVGKPKRVQSTQEFLRFRDDIASKPSQHHANNLNEIKRATEVGTNDVLPNETSIQENIWKNIEGIRRLAAEQQRATEASFKENNSYIVSSRNVLGETSIDDMDY